jgi:hypothetical protein
MRCQPINENLKSLEHNPTLRLSVEVRNSIG